MSTGSACTIFDPQQALSQHVLKNFYIGGDWVNRNPIASSNWFPR